MTGAMTGFRSLLREELIERCKRNPAYSARAFARDLRVSPAFVSQLLGGTRRLSEQKAHEVSRALSWPQQKSRVFTALVRYENARTTEAKEGIFQELRTMPGALPSNYAFTDLSLEYFRVISDWQHLAIAELSQIEGFRPDPRWIARKLGIRATEADVALERLKRIGMLVDNGKGGLKKVDIRVGDSPSEAIRNFHRQMIEKARIALDKQSPSERDITGTTMAIDPSLLPKAQELIRAFRWQLMELLESGRKRSVYHLSVQLFRLDNDGKKKGKS
jgi:uncharacterized protein (TIGR02147 family)